jgi:apolipoprotein D and lipocalin family protein
VLLRVFAGLLLVAAVGCASASPSIPAMESVSLPCFMGDWYVIAHIPSRVEREAHNAVESYAHRPDGRIQTTFHYRDGSFNAPLRTMRPVGTVRPGTGNAVWGMQFVWPIKAEYVICWVDAAYTQTIIGRSKRDYAWIMARTPSISDADFESASERLRALGYSLEELRRVPQRWPEPSGPRPRPSEPQR